MGWILFERAGVTPGLTKAEKLALLSIATRADDATRVSFPGTEWIMQWADVSRAGAFKLINALADKDMICRIGGGHRGRRAEFLIFPEPNEIAHYAAIREAAAGGKGLAQWTLSEPKASSTLDAIGEKGSSPVDPSDSNGSTPVDPFSPVDNSVEKGSSPVDPYAEKGSTFGEKGSSTLDPIPMYFPIDDSSQSSTPASTGAPVDNNDDEISHSGSGQRARRASKVGRELDVDAVLAAAPGIFEGCAEPREVAHGVALKILGKAYSARTSVMFPNRYIASALRDESHVWRREAMAIDEQRRSNG